MNNCACNNKRCAFYYSIENGVKADNPVTCKSGYISEENCSQGPISLNKGQPCSSDDECIFVNEEGEVIEEKSCECGFNGSAFSYCPLSYGDPEFEELQRALQFVIVNNFFCHTLRRFGPCEYIEDEEVRNFQ